MFMFSVRQTYGNVHNFCICELRGVHARRPIWPCFVDVEQKDLPNLAKKIFSLSTVCG